MILSKDKLVSVIIPTYKRSYTLIETIQSVLNQTYNNIEIIIVDDNGKGSKEQIDTYNLLKELIEKKLIIYIVHEINKNGSAARNTGLKKSHGYYINFLDDDDKLFPNKIEKQVKCLDKTNSEIGATYCNSKIIHYQNITHKLIVNNSNINKEGNLCIDYILGKCRFNTSMIMFKRSALEKINGFDEDFVRHQDYEIMIRFFRDFKIVSTSPEPLAIYDQTSIRINTPNCEKDFLMKEKLLQLYKEDFKKLNKEKEIGYYLWVRCAINSALKKNFYYLKKSIFLAEEYKKITIKDYIKIAKAIIVGLLK